MKLKRGQASYELPPIGKIDSVLVGVNGVLFELRPANLDRILELHADVKKGFGVPMFFGASHSTIDVWPTPDQPYEMIVRYYPPMQVI